MSSYNSENLDKIKKLSAEIVSKEVAETEERKCMLLSLQKICGMLDKPRMNKQLIREEINSLIAKMSC